MACGLVWKGGRWGLVSGRWACVEQVGLCVTGGLVCDRWARVEQVDSCGAVGSCGAGGLVWGNMLWQRLHASGDHQRGGVLRVGENMVEG